MALVQFLRYGLAFANPAEATAMLAANGGNPVLAQTPEDALDTAAGLSLSAQILQAGFPDVSTVPGFVDLGSQSTVGGIGRVPQFISTATLATDVTETLHDVLGDQVQIVTYTWSGTIIGIANVPVVPTPPVSGLPPLPPVGTYDQAVVSYTGDGAANRAVAVPFDLTVGKVAVWICGGVGAVQDANCFRANHAAMTGTWVMGSSTLQTTTGIMSFTGSGFTVSDGNIAGTHFANKLNTLYTAIVLRDTTIDNRYVRVGHYAGSGVARKITTLGKALPLTHVWVWGRGVAYRSLEMSGDEAVELAVEATPLTGMFTALGPRSFTVGTNNNVNDATLAYDYLALSVDAFLALQNVFISVTGIGGASPPLSFGIPFAIGIAFGRQLTATSTGGVWRGPDHTGTDSDFCGHIGSNPDLPTTGLTSIAANVLSMGVELAPSGATAFGWAFKAGSGSITVPPVPVPTITPVPPGVPPFSTYAPDGLETCPPPLAPAPVYQLAPYPADGAACVPASPAAPVYQTAPYPNDLPAGGCA